MPDKTECPECGRSFVDVVSHMGKRHGITHTLVDPIEGHGVGPVRTSHNEDNPDDAPPPSYAPATSHKETP